MLGSLEEMAFDLRPELSEGAAKALAQARAWPHVAQRETLSSGVGGLRGGVGWAAAMAAMAAMAVRDLAIDCL